MKSTLPFSVSRNARQRGAIFFLVIALLSLLVMVAMTMMFVSRLETLASSNAGRSVQARMAAASGVAAATRLLSADPSRFTALTQPWARGWGDRVMQAAAAPATNDEETSSGVESLARLATLDESSRLNINTVELAPPTEQKTTAQFPAAITRETFQRFIAGRLAASGLNQQQSAGIVSHIMQMREKNEGKADRNDNVALKNRISDPEDPAEIQAPAADLRRKTQDGEDQPIRKIDDLRRAPGMTDSVFDAIAPYLTTYSSSRELWYDKEDKPFVRASLNTSSVEEIHAVLSHAYSGANEYLLKQFAVNIADRRDTDTIPTAYPSSVGAYPIIGAEITPIVAEVCPDVLTLEEDGDNGEYIEIHNPLGVSVSLSGWRLDWGNGEHAFTESLPAGGFLILTDDIKNDNDDSPEDDATGMGSFFDVFRMLPVGSQSQATEILNMDIPNESGLVRLYDNHGNLIDYLVYQSGGFSGTNRGFQKRSPFSRMGAAAIATPFKSDIEKPGPDYAGACCNILYARMNQPFSSPAEVLTIPTEYLMLTRSTESRPWTFPLLQDSGGETPDVRLLDCFTIQDLPGSNRMENNELKPWDPENGPRELGGFPTVAEGTEEQAEPISKEERYRYEPVSFGKINLNTASQPVLEMLPGLDPGLIGQIMKARDDAMRQMISSSDSGAELAPFRSLGEFALSDTVWQNVEDTRRLQSLLFLSPLVTFNSCSFRVSAMNAADPVKQGKRLSQMAAQSVVHVSGKAADIITWNFVTPPSSPRSGDQSTSSPGKTAPSKLDLKPDLPKDEKLSTRNQANVK